MGPMNNPDFIQLVGFGQQGWGPALLLGAVVTMALAVSGFVIGACIGSLAAWGRIAGGRISRTAADVYTTVLRGQGNRFRLMGSAKSLWT